MELEDYFEYKNCFLLTEGIKSIEIRKSTIRNPQITIGIPTFKRATLKKTIDSALSQDYAGLYDILVVDNNPKRDDETEALIKQYNSERLSYYKNEQNIGMAGNWNRMFTLCRSEFIVMLHDDDILSPTYLSDISRILERYKDVSLITTEKIKWNENRDRMPSFRKDTGKHKLLSVSLESQYYRFLFGPPSGVVFRCKDVIDLGGFNQDYYPSIDYILVCNIIKNGRALYYKKNLLIYRLGNNATAKIETEIAWLHIDPLFKIYLSCFTNLPKILKEYSIHRDLSIRFKSIKEKNPLFTYTWKGRELKYPNYVERIIYKVLDVILCFYWKNRGKIDNI